MLHRMLLITFLSLVINVKRMGELFSGSEVISVLYKVRLKYSISNFQLYHQTRSGSRDAATSKMVCFVIIVNGWEPLTIIQNTPSWMLQQPQIRLCKQLLKSAQILVQIPSDLNLTYIYSKFNVSSTSQSKAQREVRKEVILESSPPQGIHNRKYCMMIRVKS